MRRVALAAFLLTGCTTGSQSVATHSPVVSATPVGSATATPADHVLMVIADECLGLASKPDCTNARIACAKALELFDAAKVPANDRQRGQVTAAAGRCSVDPRSHTP